VSGHAQLLRRRDRARCLVIGGALQCQREPDLVSQRNAVDVDLRVAGLRREDVPFDAQQPEPEPLIEAKRARIGGRGRDEERRMALLAADRRRALEEHPANSRALAILPDRNALHLRLVRALAGDQLQMADDGRAVSCHQHAPAIAIRAHRRG
jgi:hypothetical protein